MRRPWGLTFLAPWLLCGPITALYAFLLYLVGLYYGAKLLPDWPTTHLAWFATPQGGYIGTALTMLAIGLWLRRSPFGSRFDDAVCKQLPLLVKPFQGTVSLKRVAACVILLCFGLVLIAVALGRDALQPADIGCFGLIGAFVGLWLGVECERRRNSWGGTWSLVLTCFTGIGVLVFLGALCSYVAPARIIDEFWPALSAISARRPAPANSFAWLFTILQQTGDGIFLGLWAVVAMIVFWTVLAHLRVLARWVGRRMDERDYAILPAFQAALGSVLIQIGLWGIIVPTISVLVLLRLPTDLLSDKALVEKRATTFLTTNLVLLAFVTACAVIVWGWRRSWVCRTNIVVGVGIAGLGVISYVALLVYCIVCAKHPLAESVRWLGSHVTGALGAVGLTMAVISACVLNGKEAPRLIVNSLILLGLGTAAVLGGLLIIDRWWTGGRWSVHLERYTLPASAVVVLATAGGLFKKGLRDGLHVAMDVLSHFYQPSLLPGGALDITKFSIQQRIEHRFKCVLGELLHQFPSITDLTIVAHSQGTVIALDVLWYPETWDSLKGRCVRLVTMGSPFSHLYQHYFPYRYPPLFKGDKFNIADWGAKNGRTPDAYLRKTVKQWINLFREDDFIGTRIRGDPDNTFPRNLPALPAGGHTGYWSQEEAIRQMSGFLPVPA